jgi:hypothetical protein
MSKAKIRDIIADIVAGQAKDRGDDEEQARSKAKAQLGTTFGKEFKGRGPQMPILAKRDWSWMCDYVRIKDKGQNRLVFSAVEMTSRRAFACAFPRAFAENPDAKGTLECIQQLESAFPVNLLHLDNGVEFDNTLVRAWAERKKIDIYYPQVGQKQEMSFVENFNRSLRASMVQLRSALSKAGGVWSFTKALDDIWRKWNKTDHRYVGTAPDDVKEEDMGKIRVINGARALSYLSRLHKFKPGMSVVVKESADPRISQDELDEASKLGKRLLKYTDDVFTVVKQVGYKLVLRLGDEEFKRRVSPRDLKIVKRDVADEDEESMGSQESEAGPEKPEKPVQEPEPERESKPKGKRAPKPKQMMGESEAEPDDKNETLSKLKDVPPGSIKVLDWFRQTSEEDGGEGEEDVIVFEVKYASQVRTEFVNAVDTLRFNDKAYAKTAKTAEDFIQAHEYKQPFKAYVDKTKTGDGDETVRDAVYPYIEMALQKEWETEEQQGTE